MTAVIGENDFLAELKKALSKLHRTNSSHRESDGADRRHTGLVDDDVDAPLLSKDTEVVVRTSSESDKTLATRDDDDVDDRSRTALPVAGDDDSRKSIFETSRGNCGQLLLRDIIAARFDRQPPPCSDPSSPDSRVSCHSDSRRETMRDGVASSPVRSTACSSDNAPPLIEATAPASGGGVFYGELSSVLQKRSEQRPDSAMRVMELESKSRTGNSVMYIGRGGTKRDSATHSISEDIMSSSTTLMTIATVEGGNHSFRQSGISFRQQYATNRENRAASSHSNSAWRNSTVSRRSTSMQPTEVTNGNRSTIVVQSYADLDEVSRTTSPSVDVVDCPFRRTSCFVEQTLTEQRTTDLECTDADQRETTAAQNDLGSDESHRVESGRAQSVARRTQSAPDSMVSDGIRAVAADQRLSRSVPRLPESESELGARRVVEKMALVDEPPTLADNYGLTVDIWRLMADGRIGNSNNKPSRSTPGLNQFLDNETTTETLDSRLSPGNETSDPASGVVASMSSSTWTSDDHLSDSTTSTSGTDRRDAIPSLATRTMTDIDERSSTATPLSSLHNRDSACPFSDSSVNSPPAGARTSSSSAVARPPVQRDWSATSFRRVQSENDVVFGVVGLGGAAIASAVARRRHRDRKSCSSVDVTSTGKVASSTGGFEGTEQCTSIEVNLYSSTRAPIDADRRPRSYKDDEVDDDDDATSDTNGLGLDIMRKLIESSMESKELDGTRSSLGEHSVERPRDSSRLRHEQTRLSSHVTAAGSRLSSAVNDYGDQHFGGCGFATFPMQRQPQVRYCSGGMTSIGNQDDRDVIANLMITHSGEPMCVGLFDTGGEAKRVTTMTSHNDLPPLSVPVTVPVPTSFHQVGSLACQQLIGVSEHQLLQRELATGGLPSSSSVAAASQYGTSSDSQSTRSSSDNRSRVVRHQRIDRHRPTATNGSRTHRCVDWSSSSETGGSNGFTANTRLKVTGSEDVCDVRGPSDSLLEADISAGSSFDESTTKAGRRGHGDATHVSVELDPERRRLQQREQQERKLGRNWRLSQSPLMLHQQATYCVNSDKQLVRLDLVSRQRRRHNNRDLHRRPMSADDVLMDRGKGAVVELPVSVDDQQTQLQSEDESFRRNSAISCDDEFERSLIQYVKNDEMTVDMRTLYRHQLDSTMTTGVTWNRKSALKHANTASTIMDQLSCCFVCNYNASGTTAASSRRSPVKKHVHCYSAANKNKNVRRLPTIADYTSVPVTAYGLGLVKGNVDQTSDFFVDTKGLRGSLKVQVDGPSHSVKCYAESVTDCRYRIYYLPSEVGIFTVNITWNDHHLDGSPFHAKVVDPRQVVVVGGWNKLLDKRDQLVLKVGVEKQLDFDVRQAGPGKLTTVIEGPTGELSVIIKKTEVGKYSVSFTPETEGVHHMSINWSDVPISRSPLSIIVVHSITALENGDTAFSRLSCFDGVQTTDRTDVVCPDRVLVVAASSALGDDGNCQLISPQLMLAQQLALTETRAQQNIEFVIDGSRGAGPGVPNVKLIGLKEEVEVVCGTLGNGRYTCTCSPQHPGAYLLEVTWSGHHVNGSPFKLTVLPSGDASQVVCYLDGQNRPSVGSELKVHICTDNTGPGELSVCCAGPQTMAPCKLVDHQNGHFSLHIRPLEGGVHHLSVQFNGTHVPGSPFDIRVMGQVDASKVSVSGPGVKDGLLSNYCSYFIVDTTGAGVGQLTVRIRGPKGAFRVEMMRHHPKDRTILCRFDPTEAGQYTIHVKWSGINVPGSPFTVNIFQKAQELDTIQSDKVIKCSTNALL